MKYKYQDTEIIVESSNELDSTFFRPIEEKSAEKSKTTTLRKKVAKTIKK